jgi:hypothetical protein
VSRAVPLAQVSGRTSEHAVTPRDASEAPVANSVAELAMPEKALELALFEAAKAGQWAIVTALARALAFR